MQLEALVFDVIGSLLLGLSPAERLGVFVQFSVEGLRLRVEVHPRLKISQPKSCGRI